MYADILKKIVTDYDYYKDIAVNLEWTDFNSRYYDWYKKYPVGICADRSYKDELFRGI